MKVCVHCVDSPKISLLRQCHLECSDHLLIHLEMSKFQMLKSWSHSPLRLAMWKRADALVSRQEWENWQTGWYDDKTTHKRHQEEFSHTMKGSVKASTMQISKWRIFCRKPMFDISLTNKCLSSFIHSRGHVSCIILSVWSSVNLLIVLRLWRDSR